MSNTNLTYTNMDRAPATRMTSLLSLLGLGAALALMLFATMRTPLKDDIAWLLYVARKWLAGKQLYVDLVEINPPLIIWMSAIPAMAGEWLGLAARNVAMPFFAGISLACAWWTARLLRGLAPVFANPVPVFAVIGVVLLLIPGPEMGQREHLLAAFSLPYLVVLARALHGTPIGGTPIGGTPTGGMPIGGMSSGTVTALASGVVAGLGVALKPRYGLAFAAVELLALACGLRPWRAQALGAGLLLVLYAALTVWLYPAYLEHAVPLALALYGATDASFQSLLFESRTMLLGVVVLALLAGRAMLIRGEQRGLLAVLALFAAASAVVCLMDGKDWFYHRLPAMIVVALALVLWLTTEFSGAGATGAWTGRWLGGRWLPAGLALAVGVIFTATAAQRITPRMELAFHPEVSTEVRLQRILKKERANTYVAFSEWIALGFPVVNEAGVTWASRFDSMWALKGELWRAQSDPEAVRDWPVRHWVARDFVAGCPDVVVADVRVGGPNYIGILSASDAAFARAWEGYRQIAAFDGLIVYRRRSNGCGEVPPTGAAVAQPDPAQINAPSLVPIERPVGEPPLVEAPQVNAPTVPMLSRVSPGSR